MTVPLLLFARFRERAGCTSVEVPSGISVSELRNHLKVLWPDLAHLIDSSRFAANNEFVEDGHPLLSGEELALIPPVSGG